MRGSKAKTLVSLFGSAIKAPPKSKSKLETLDAIPEHDLVSSSTVALDYSALNLFVSATSLAKKSKEEAEPSVLDSLSAFNFPGFKSVARSDSDVVEESAANDEPKQDHLTNQISSILIADALVKAHHLEDEEDDETISENELDTEWIPTLSRHSLWLRRKEVVQDRKLTWSFSTCQGGCFNRLVNMCAKKVGIETAFNIFGKLGVPKGAAEYDAILKVCVETARLGNTETIIIEQLNKAFMYFKSMKEHGFQLEEDIYGPFVSYLIETAMVEEFYFFSDIIKDVNPNTSPRLGYYEMLLWITVDDEEKVQDLCHHMLTEECDTDIIENYLLALWEGGRDKELMQLLKTLDFTTFTSTDNLLAIFKALGKLQWNDLVEKFLLAFKARDFRDEDLSDFICSHIVGNPNLGVEDVILSFKNRHTKLEVKPSSASYDKLIRHCCELREMEAVLRLIDEAIESGLTVSLETIHHVLQSSEESYDFILVHRIYSLIREFKLEADVETFRMMIRLCVRMKNMEVAKNMLRDMEEMKLAPTSTIYNILMVACLQEKNYLGVENVLKQMQNADIQPDSLTFSHLIRKSATEEEIDKYWEVLQNSGIKVSTPVYMALIQAYANCGLLEKAKQVVAGKWIPGREVYRIKGVLVKALAIHGQFFEALKIYKESKEAGQKVGPKATISLIEYYEPNGESNILLDLLEELTDPEYWLDGCARAILNCVRRKDLSLATNLLKQLKDKLSVDDEMILEAILDEVFNVIGDKESTHMQIGMDLLRVVKDDLGLAPPRKCLDFLLHACVAAKDLENSRVIWKEYDDAGLPHNIISCLRMYQALLASGDHKAANTLLTKIPKDDPHVRYVTRASQVTFAGSLMKNTKVKKIKKKKKKTEKKTMKGL